MVKNSLRTGVLWYPYRMTRRSRLISVNHDEDTGAETTAPADSNSAAHESSFDEEELAEVGGHDESMTSRGRWAIPLLAALAIGGWTAFFVWVNFPRIQAGAAPAQWSSWIVSWCVPVLLVVALWLLAMRSSTREARRFGDAASTLARESALLEERLVTVNRELSLAREFIAAQSRDLESLGRIATERLSENADRLQSLIRDNSAQVESIGNVSDAALANMDRLRGELPVIATSARDVASQIGHAGQTAQGQLDELVKGFHRLNEFGSASERQVETLRTRIENTLAELERQGLSLGESVEHRYGEIRHQAGELSAILREAETDALEKWKAGIVRLEEDMREAIERVETLDESALSSANRRLIQLREEAERVDAALAERNALFDTQMAERRAAADARDAEDAAALADRFAALDTAIGERHAAHVEKLELLQARGVALSTALDEMDGQLAETGSQSELVENRLASAAETLRGRLVESRAAIEGTDRAVAELTDASVRLLELVRAGAQHTAEDLPAAIGTAEERLTLLGADSEKVAAHIALVREHGDALAERIAASRDLAGDASQTIESAAGRLAELGETERARLEDWRDEIEAIELRSREMAEGTAAELSGSLEALKGAVDAAVSHLREGGSAAVDDFAAQIGERSAQSIRHAIGENTADAIAELEAAAARAASDSRETTRSLRDQLARVHELTGNLEARIQEARARAEERTDNDFARRVALITESLNSNAIDISKALSNEVTDTAWASYLKGDRGIFTRRAVRLLDREESRPIAEVYEDDPDFREHVSRYIHDFEAMLRTMLSTRDGNALAVTLLSSDMGKLYVALAQAIDRLRD